MEHLASSPGVMPPGKRVSELVNEARRYFGLAVSCPDRGQRFAGRVNPLDTVIPDPTIRLRDSGRVLTKEMLMRLKLARSISAVVVSIVVVGTSIAGDAVLSGLKVGESVSPFQVDDITGPNKGTSLCYR